MSGAIKVEEVKSYDELLCTSGPFASMFRNVLLKAKELNASDIHIEPKKDDLVIRFRVNGDLSEFIKLKGIYSKPFLFEVKKIAGMSIAQKGKPQDSRVSYPSIGIDLRGSAIPSIYDDKLVFRVIDNESSVNLKALGHPEEVINILKDSIKFKNGLILLSGPTGSGKSSTLYSILNLIDRKKLNVITIEDPVERIIEGTTPIHVKKGFRFADALKSAMRQDPDVIFIGEIRDKESAKIAIDASNTGHLVISTIHANDCFSVIERLEGLGVDKVLIEKNLKFVGAQRLVKVLCPKCKAKDGTSYFKQSQSGCEYCSFTGVVSRRPILDYLKYPIDFDSSNDKSRNNLKEIARKYLVKGELCSKEWEAIE